MSRRPEVSLTVFIMWPPMLSLRGGSEAGICGSSALNGGRAWASPKLSPSVFTAMLKVGAVSVPTSYLREPQHRQLRWAAHGLCFSGLVGPPFLLPTLRPALGCRPRETLDGLLMGAGVGM